jgi:predicted Zn finger-like uncharacterized protein
MRLACPSCQAKYEVPDALLSEGGRRLRCARCATDWFVGAPAASGDVTASGVASSPQPAGAAEPARGEASVPLGPPVPISLRAEPRPSAASRPETRPPAPVVRGGAGAGVVVLAWVLSLAVLGGAAAACYRWRAEVMATWPPSQRVYAFLGLQ